jgi:predicted RNase H-like HicB family nuclease
MIEKPLYVRTEWDADAGVWVATSDDVPGLVTEADTMEKLIAKLQILIPELLELNGDKAGLAARSFEVLSRRFESLEPAGV